MNTTWLAYYESMVIGFVSLCADSLRLAPDEKEEVHVPYVNIPSLKIARLAIHKDFQTKGLGKLFIKFTVSKTLLIRETIGVKLITVDCYKHRISYYEHIGFLLNKVQKPNREEDSPLSFRLNVDKYLENLVI